MFRAVDKVQKKGAKGVYEEYKDKIGSSKLQALIDISMVKGNIDGST